MDILVGYTPTLNRKKGSRALKITEWIETHPNSKDSIEFRRHFPKYNDQLQECYLSAVLEQFSAPYLLQIQTGDFPAVQNYLMEQISKIQYIRTDNGHFFY